MKASGEVTEERLNGEGAGKSTPGTKTEPLTSTLPYVLTIFHVRQSI